MSRRAFLKTDRYDRTVVVTFPYNERGVQVMHTCGGRWDPGKRRWVIAEQKVDLVVAEFEAAGYRVVLDEKLLPPANPSCPWLTLSPRG